jgi:hypothetical protein
MGPPDDRKSDGQRPSSTGVRSIFLPSSVRLSPIPKHMKLANKMSCWINLFVFPALVLTIFDAYCSALAIHMVAGFSLAALTGIATRFAAVSDDFILNNFVSVHPLLRSV